MRLFADENVPEPIFAWLAASGHDVTYACVLGPETEDVEWLDRTWRDARIVVTADRDYGDLVFRQRRPSRGVIYLRLDSLPVPDRIRRLQEVWPVIESDAAGRFVTVTTRRLRVRDLPPVPSDEEE